MHLINVNTLRLELFVGDSIPPYAILSHTWGANQEEISFEDIQKGNIEKPGNGTKKLKGCCKQAKEDHLEYAWIDTCCIDKKSSNELEEAINSMFQWYRKASVCYAYLSDVPSGDSHLDRGSKFFSSRWFQRGWTLQELLAPKQLRFYDQKWTFVGTKASISGAIEVITGISRQFLLGWVDFRQASVAQRMSWAANRQTSRREDTAYCLLGIFDVTMPMIYGEGDRALSRLQREIMKSTGDHSILAWGLDLPDPTPRKLADAIPTGILAATPSDFANCRRIVQRTSDATLDGTFDISGGRLRAHLSLYTTSAGETYGLLNCGPEHRADQIVGIPVQEVVSDGGSDEYFRPQGRHSILLPRPATSNISTRLMCIHMERRGGVHEAVGKRLWLYLDGYREVNLKLEEFYPTVCWENERTVVSEAGESDTYPIRRYLARFRTHGHESRDVIAVLEFQMDGLQSQARCHVMASSRDTALEDLSRAFMYMRPQALGKQAANVGSLHVDVTIEQDRVAHEPMWIVKLALASGSLDATVDANLELEQVNMRLECMKILQDKDQIYLEAKCLIKKKDEDAPAINQMKARLRAIEESLQELGEEKSKLTEEVEKRIFRVVQVYESLKEAQQQQAERSKRISEIQRHLDETNRGHGNWLETHISVFLNEIHMMGSSKEARDSDNGRPQSSKGGWSKPKTASQIPLSWAAMSGQAAVAKLLLERGADMEAKDRYGRTPISLAAEKGHEAVVSLLVERGADLEAADDDGHTAMSLASFNKHGTVVMLLGRKGARLGRKDKFAHTPVFLAAPNGHEAVDCGTPVSGAAFSGHEAVVSLWAEKAANKKRKGNDRRTPISRAVLGLLRLGRR